MIRFKRLFKSFIYAFKGLFRVLREEQNLKIQSFFGVLAICLGFILGIKPVEWCFIIVSIFLVLLMEIVNSAVERVTDVLKPRIHQYIKEIKDIMAAAVMLASLVSVIIGGIIFLPYILALL